MVFEYLEDLGFDGQFDMSLFEAKSESVVGSTILNPEFFKILKLKRPIN